MKLTVNPFAEQQSWMALLKSAETPAVKTRMDDRSRKRKEGNEPCPGLAP